MTEEAGDQKKTEVKGGMGQLTDEGLLKISELDIENKDKYSDEDRDRHKKLNDDARLKRYNKEPNSFIEVREIITCVIRTPFGPMMILQGTKTELQLAWAEVSRKTMDELRRMDLEAAMKKQSVIQKPGSFMGGLRTMGKKKH